MPLATPQANAGPGRVAIGRTRALDLAGDGAFFIGMFFDDAIRSDMALYWTGPLMAIAALATTAVAAWVGLTTGG